MGETKNLRKKADGIRRHMDAVRPQASASRTVPSRQSSRPAHEKVSDPGVRQETSHALPAKNSFLERSEHQVGGSKDSHIIHDRAFKKKVLPTGLSFLTHTRAVAVCSAIGVSMIAVFLLSTVFARATITLKPVVENISVDSTQIFFDASVSEVNVKSRIVPAELLSFTGSASEDFDATGSDVVNQKAGGRVRIYNAFGTSPQTLVATTRFVTDAGVLFRIPKSITVPAAKKSENGSLVPQFVEAELIADKAGAGSNIAGEVKLRVPGFKDTPKYNGFYAIASGGFSGGSIGQGKVVTRNDLTVAQEKLSKKVFNDLKQGMVQKIPANFTYVDSLGEIEITAIIAPKEKTKIDRFKVEVKAVARVFVFRNLDVMSFLNQTLLAGDATKSLIDNSATLHYQIKNANYEKKIADVSMSGNIKSKKVILSDEIVPIVVGKKEGSLVEALKKRKDISTFRVRFFPPWISSAPNNAKQIIVIVEDPSGGIISSR